MLHRSDHRNVADQRAPERERRLCWLNGHAEDSRGSADHDENGEHGEHGEGPAVDPVRQKLREAMEATPWGAQLFALEQRVDALGTLFAQSKVLLEDEGIKALVKDAAEKEGIDKVKEWESNITWTKTEGEILGGEANYLRDVIEFSISSFTTAEYGSAQRFIGALKGLAKAVKDPEQYKAALEAFEARQRGNLENWNNLTPAQRSDVIADVWSSAKIGEVLNAIEKETDTREKTIAEIRVTAEELRAFHQKQASDSGEEGLSEEGVGAMFNIKFYSLASIMDAFQQIKSAYEHAHHEKVRLGGGQIAKAVSPIIEWGPYGHDVAHHIDEEFENQNTKIANEEKERLTRENVSFRALFFGEHGHEAILHSFVHQGLLPKARGVVEYAASRGWLYDIDEIGMDALILGKFRLRDVLPSDWSDDRISSYFLRIRGNNRSGMKEEREKVKARENKDSFDLFLAAVQKEFDELNLWGAVGVIERAIERGLSDVVVTRLTVEVLRRFRDDPEIRKYASLCRELIDQIGMLSMYTTTPTLGWFKYDRRNIQMWLQRDGKNVQDATKLGKAVLMIEDEIQQKMGGALPHDPAERQKKIDDIVGQVLTGQRVQVEDSAGNKRTITLYSKRYEFYTNLEKNEYFRNQGATKVHEQDIDYYIGNTDQFLGAPGNVNAIWEYGSTRELLNETNGKLFAQKLLLQAIEYKEAGEIEYMNTYLREMRSRLDSYAENKLVREEKGTILKMLDLKIDVKYDNRNGEEQKIHAAPMFGILVAYGLISPHVFFSDSAKDTEVSKAIEKQLHDYFHFTNAELQMMKTEPHINPRVGF